MNRVLLSKCIKEARLLFLCCFAGLFLFCFLRMYIVSRVEMDSFATIVGELWDKWSDFSPVSLKQLLSYPGRVAITFDEPIVLLCITVFAISRGSDCISGELGRGTMEMLLAQPITRTQIVATQGMVTVYGVALLALAVWTGLAAGVNTFKTLETGPQPTFKIPGLHVSVPIPWAKPVKSWVPLSKVVQVDDYLAATANLFSFGVCLAGVATCLSAFDRYRWRTIGITVGLYVLQMMIKLGATAVPELKWLHLATIFSAYQPQKIVERAVNQPETAWALGIFHADGRFETLGPLGCDLILLAIGAIGYMIAVVRFNRRDIPAPL